jgi:hypothetical protein
VGYPDAETARTTHRIRSANADAPPKAEFEGRVCDGEVDARVSE